MEGLGEDCTSKILSLTTPSDVCRLSYVNKTFMYSSSSDIVWDSFLSHHILNIRSSIPDLSYSSKKQVYFQLCKDPILIHNGSKKMIVWVEKGSGILCVRISARDMQIKQGNDSRFWQWNSHHYHPCYKEVAEVVAILELEVIGTLDYKLLTPGVEYNICFEIKLIRCSSDEDEDDGDILDRCLGVGNQEAFGWDKHPVMFSVEYPPGNVQEKYIFLTEQRCCKINGHVWMEVEAGRITIEDRNNMYKNGDSKNEEEVEIKVKMRQADGRGKGGLVLGGIVVQPAN